MHPLWMRWTLTPETIKCWRTKIWHGVRVYLVTWIILFSFMIWVSWRGGRCKNQIKIDLEKVCWDQFGENLFVSCRYDKVHKILYMRWTFFVNIFSSHNKWLSSMKYCNPTFIRVREMFARVSLLRCG